MDKYTDPSATIDGEFTDGDPELGVPRSLLKAEWPNMIQRELIALVQSAGLVLDSSDFTQVLQAVTSMGFETGDLKYSYRAVPSFGWLLIDGKTIGNADSGATSLAAASAENLFVFLWENFDDALCPVSGGRGLDAASDFGADKTIRLFDDRGLFHRVWDNGAGVDAARALGSAQDSQNKSHSHFLANTDTAADPATLGDDNYLIRHGNTDDGSSEYFLHGSGAVPTVGLSSAQGGDEARPVSRAVNVFIKL